MKYFLWKPFKGPFKRFLHVEMGNDIYELFQQNLLGVLLQMQCPGPYPSCTESESLVEVFENILKKKTTP